MHTLGNLTLVTGKLNPALSNGPWGDKLPEILKHSALALNRELGEIPSWDEAAIRKRGERLFEFARVEWARTDGQT